MSPTASDNSFRERYQALQNDLRRNEQQWRVFEATGSCTALAGPGSGKTKTLSVKVARLLLEEVASPRGVACITYSNECVNEIAHRLAQLGIEPNYRFFLGTIHRFCFQHVARPYGGMGNFTISNLVATPEQQRQWKREALVAERLPTSKRAFDLFDAYRREPLSRTGSWCAHPAFGRAIVRYENALIANDLTDFEEMVRAAVTLVYTEPWVAKVLVAKFPVLVVDEYQDLGYGLHKLVTELKSQGARVIAVGDPDQSIYSFNGAKPALLVELYAQQGPETVSVQLETNYRCTQKIIDASVCVLGQPRPYMAHHPEGGLIGAYPVDGGWEAQAAFAVKHLLPEIERNNINLGEVGFLYPDRHVGKGVANVLTANRVAFRGGTDEVRYKRSPATMLVEECALWCIKGGISDEPRLSSILSRWERLFKVDGESAKGRAIRSKFVNYLWNQRRAEIAFADWLDGLFSLGLIDLLDLVPEKEHERTTLQSMEEAARDPSRLAGWSLAEFARTRIKGELPHLVTIHSSKGLEYDAVIILGLEGLADSDDAEKRDEERRKLYVALTRARKSLYLLWSGATPKLIRPLEEGGYFDLDPF